MYTRENFDILGALPVVSFLLKRSELDLQTNVSKFLEIAFEFNGFIAGGCAAAIARYKHRTKTLSNQNLEYYFTESGGDIDVYFHTEKDLNDAQASLEKVFQKQFVLSSLGTARNLQIPLSTQNKVPFKFRKNLKLSLIQCQIGSPEEVMDNFDITNAKVAITKDAIIMHNAWLPLENAQVLDVSAWNNKFEFFRIKKYLSKWSYSRLSKRTAQQVVHAGKIIYKDLESKKIELSELIKDLNEKKDLSVKVHCDNEFLTVKSYNTITIRDLSDNEHAIDIRDSLLRLQIDLNDISQEMSNIRKLVTSKQNVQSLSLQDVDEIISVFQSNISKENNSNYTLNPSFRDAMKKFISDYQASVHDEFSDLL